MNRGVTSGEAPASGASVPARLAALGLASMAADLGSVYLKSPLGPLGVTVGDWVSGAGAYVVLALYFWAASGLGSRLAGGGLGGSTGAATLLFLLAAVTYALGTGIHVSANSIHDMLEATGGPDPWRLAYFWDETASHYMVDSARVAFAVSLTQLEGRGGDGAPSSGGSSRAVRGWSASAGTALWVGAIAYGFIYFATAVEGQTVPLALPYSIAFAAWGVARSRRHGGRAPALAFFTAAAVVSAVLFAVWGFWKGGFPEFTKAGLVP